MHAFSFTVTHRITVEQRYNLTVFPVRNEKSLKQNSVLKINLNLLLIYVLQKLKLILRRETASTCYLCAQMKSLLVHSPNK